MKNAPHAFDELFKKDIAYMNGESDLHEGETVDNVVMGLSLDAPSDEAAAALVSAVREYTPYILRKGPGLFVVSMVSLMKIFHGDLFAYSMECAKRAMKSAEVRVGLHYAPMAVGKNEANPAMAGFSRRDLNLGFILPGVARELDCRLVLTQSFATNYPASLFARYLKTISVEGEGDFRIYQHGAL